MLASFGEYSYYYKRSSNAHLRHWRRDQFRDMTKQTITINGRTYDAVTGLLVTVEPHHVHQPDGRPHEHSHHPVRAFSDIGPSTTVHELRKPERPAYSADLEPAGRVLAPHEVHAAAQAMHQTTQKSQTLYRQALAKPAPEPAVQHHERSPLISRFSDTQPEPPQDATPTPEPEAPVQQPVMHPAVAKALQTQALAHPVAQPQPSGTDLKEQLIKERLAEVGTGDMPKKGKKTNWLSRQPRMVAILSSTLALLILGGYLTYITLPSISLRVAASRAGINASMPDYKPDGYSLDGPITYSPGAVVVSYKSNTNDSGYKLTQKASNWDSQAVLDNYVSKQTDNYLTFQERGITVYTFNNKATWVNGGMLYTIEGNAALSSDQVLRVATSL